MKPVVPWPRDSRSQGATGFFGRRCANRALPGRDRALFGPNAGQAQPSACGSRKPRRRIVAVGYITAASAATVTVTGIGAARGGRGGSPVRTMRIGAPQQRQRSGGRDFTSLGVRLTAMPNSRCSSVSERLLLGFRKPKLRARRKPLMRCSA
jgi:hypothetical protein